MTKKIWTKEEKQAFADKMKKAKLQKVNSNLTKQADKQTDTDETLSKHDQLLEVLIKMVDTLQKNQSTPIITPSNPIHNRQNSNINISSTGDIQGIINKYPIDKDFYPNPVNELLDYAEKAMPAIAIRVTHDILWDVVAHPYQTANNIWYNEPWHIIQIDKRLFDDQGEPLRDKDSGDEIVIRWRVGYFFEDEIMVKQAANKQGLKDYDSDNLANEIRLLRMKRWLKDIFYPPKPKPTHSDRQVVVNGQVVIQKSRTILLPDLPEKSAIRI